MKIIMLGAPGLPADVEEWVLAEVEKWFEEEE